MNSSPVSRDRGDRKILFLTNSSRVTRFSVCLEAIMKSRLAVLVLLLATLPALAQSAGIGAQPGAAAVPAAVIHPGDNLVVENIPPIPAGVAEKANQYAEFRTAGFSDWNPARREMLIATRFAEVPQIHLVKMPGGARSQLTFFPDRTAGARFGPDGTYFVFGKDVGGGEWYQFYRYNLADGNVTLLTDG